MKQLTEKANELKKIESLKDAKRIQKEQLAKKYDEMIENSKPKEEVKEEVKEEIKPKEDIKPKEEPKPLKKKRIIKKVIYQEASSDSDSADEVEVVKVKKSSKNKNIENVKPQPQQNNNNSYSNLLYESSIDNLKNRMMNERARSLVMSIMPSYG